jgi:3-mercaptopyruvate sulfurtransferase SseA
MVRILKQAVLIVLIPAVAGLLVNHRLVLRFVRGEFGHGFVDLAKTPEVVPIDFQRTLELWQAGTAVFIDARAAGLFARGHIPGAVNLPPGEPLSRRVLSGLDLHPERPIVVYCEGGSCLDSLHLARELAALHRFPDLRVYFGGWEEWVERGLPVEEDGGGQE